MEEIQSQSDNYRSSSSSASSPVSRVPSSNFFYLRKPGSLRQPISFEDSPDWEETDVDVRMEEGGDSINVATTPASPSLSKLNSCSLPSPPLPESTGVARKVNGAYIAWKDLTVTIKGKRKYSDKVVKSSNGYALPGTMTVIMGPAKSGKTTLLRAIGGRLDRSAKIYGEVFVNGAKSRMPYGSYGFVEKETTLIGSLTVREFLFYSALLQPPGFFFRKKNVVEEAIHAMSLSDYANKLIGGHCYMKGLPNGERRRVSIARELVMRPQILFIDEPLYHLDSVSALLMMVTLKKLASTGYTLVFSINQSSTEVFGLFDRICLLSNGNTLFFGETLACLQHFANAGFPCPIMQSPSDHFLRAVNTDFDRIIAMCKTWQTRVAAVFVFVSFTSLLSVAGVPALMREVKIYTSEESNYHSGAFVFLLGQLLSSIPFLFLVSISSSLIFYFLVGLRDEFSLLMYFVLNFFMCLLVNEGLILVMASLWRNIFWIVLTLVSAHVLMMLSAGYFRIRNALPGPVWTYPLSYIAFHTYSIQGLLENEYLGSTLAVGEVRNITGYQAIHSAYDISSNTHSKWKNLLVLFLMVLAYRVLALVLLHFRVGKFTSLCKVFCCNRHLKD
ncbi:ABC transporter G family member 3-like isoform X3 [Cucurbita moschata]|uniref:ABC transporter G family member 3-like isoform X3 n=1 Tax=Cucurbita moschata TaxID=3662 RepID=A0A6J1HMF5_CUCMO|nr:ABC transporter G family member 3-like isoform X3 [Cucurbita moschata]